MSQTLSDIAIGATGIGTGHRPWIIAEMSANHNGSLDRALEIVDAAAAAGAHALKIQTFTPDSITLKVTTGDFIIDDKNSLWVGRSLYDLYSEGQTPLAWHKPIFDRCRERGLVGFSSPFSIEAVDSLEKLGVPAYKIASFESNHVPLLRRVAKTKKPVIVSTGMATETDIALAVETLRSNGCRQIVLLKCTSSYPAPPDESNLRTIPYLSEKFGCHVGLSDHTLGIGAAVAACALGARVIEKHFTLSRADAGLDSSFSLEPAELASLVVESERAWKSVGSVFVGPTDREKPSMKYRRSIYISRDLKSGDILSPSNVKVVRPGLGLAPKFYDDVLGKRVKGDVKAGTALSWDLLTEPPAGARS